MTKYKTHNKWTQEELDVLKSAYALGGLEYAYQVLCSTFEGFDRNRDAVKSTVFRYKFSAPTSGCFPKGNVPVNKGRSMHKDVYERAEPTMFKKGHLPHNTKHDGCMSIRKDSRGVPYQFIRVAKAKWVHLHRKVWMDANGEIPRGHIVRFLNGDTMDCSIENLECISRSEHIKRNHKGHLFAKKLTDAYVRGVLKRRGADPSIITTEMIQLKRAELLLQRTIKEQQHGK